MFLNVGGTTIENWMNSLAPLNFSSGHRLGLTPSFRSSPQHFTGEDIQKLFCDEFFDYSFMFVRNPYNRIESEYRYLHSLRYFKRSVKNLWTIPSFNQWIKSSLREVKSNPWIFDNHLRPQWHYLYPSIDIYKMEDGLLSGIKSVARKIGVDAPTELPHLNHTHQMNVATPWSDESRSLVAEYYARDFKEFGYET